VYKPKGVPHKKGGGDERYNNSTPVMASTQKSRQHRQSDLFEGTQVGRGETEKVHGKGGQEAEAQGFRKEWGNDYLSPT